MDHACDLLEPANRLHSNSWYVAGKAACISKKHTKARTPRGRRLVQSAGSSEASSTSTRDALARQLSERHIRVVSHTLCRLAEAKKYNIKYRDLHKKQPPSHGDVQARMVTPSLGQRYRHMEWLKGGLHVREEDEGWKVTRTSHQRKQQLSAKHLHAGVENTSPCVTIPTAITHK